MCVGEGGMMMLVDVDDVDIVGTVALFLRPLKRDDPTSPSLPLF